jgi:hypothetical protein
MTPATIEPLTTGEARMSWQGEVEVLPSWSEAVAKARRLGIPHSVLPFPALGYPAPVTVLAVAPSFRVLP